MELNCFEPPSGIFGICLFVINCSHDLRESKKLEGVSTLVLPLHEPQVVVHPHRWISWNRKGHAKCDLIRSYFGKPDGNNRNHEPELISCCAMEGTATTNSFLTGKWSFSSGRCVFRDGVFGGCVLVILVVMFWWHFGGYDLSGFGGVALVVVLWWCFSGRVLVLLSWW